MVTAQTLPQVKKTTATATSPVSGKEMYAHYCASCHGKDGKGDGPAARAMKSVPTDLTQLSATNSGKFPELKVAHAIDGTYDLAAHGSRDMPTWGEVFHQMDGSGMQTAKIRIANLTAYLQSLQAK
jgi:mono/diheme cytochrome c family protein